MFSQKHAKTHQNNGQNVPYDMFLNAALVLEVNFLCKPDKNTILWYLLEIMKSLMQKGLKKR